jgi:hypothetical protein
VIQQLALALQMLSEAIAKGKNSIHLGDLDRMVEALEHRRQILRAPTVTTAR